jgi:hypothetical protein
MESGRIVDFQSANSINGIHDPESFNAVNAYLSLLEFAAVIDIQMPKPTEHQ